MKKVYFIFIFFLFLLISPSGVFAQTNSFANIVNPVRGGDFWEMGGQKPEDAVLGELEILRQKNVTATWLIRYDAFKNPEIMNALKAGGQTDEKGLFLEVTPTFTTDAGVGYRQSRIWHFAESVLLTGYEVEERKKLIDRAFEEFKAQFGYYPKSVGAWWIDAGSLAYMEEKYKISGALIVADQYSTDNYQIWGQYWSTPYYPRKDNALYPAQNKEQKLAVVMFQWAARDPVNGYGKGVEESTYSVQANDYIDYHDLDINYFSKLVDIYTIQKQSSFGEIVVGLENSYDWKKYKSEYEKQVQTLIDKQKIGQLQISTMDQFSTWYKNRFPEISPQHAIVASDPLGSDRKVVWFMNSFYRAGWFSNNQGSVFRDVRQYVEGDKEPCLLVACKEVNFATFKTRTLDEVTYQDNYIVDRGKIANFESNRLGGQIGFSYDTGAGKKRTISYLERDIKMDDRVFSIDGLILLAKEQKLSQEKKLTIDDKPIADYYFSFGKVAAQFFVFVIFLILAILIPGFMISRIFTKDQFLLHFFLSFSIGITLFTLASFVFGLFGMYWLQLVLQFGFIFVLFWKKLYRGLFQSFSFNWFSVLLAFVIFAGVFFQSLGVMRSGWVYDFGIGFWGPTGHDHIWHQALNNQIAEGLPIAHPIFAGTTLTNYHYFFNILAGVTGVLTGIDPLHLLYRFYPVLFSLLLGIGFYLVAQKLFANRFVSLMTVYFVYFGSSFGWIVDYIRSKTFGGESNFWINQPVSFNLNPPFAISMVLLLAILLLFSQMQKDMNLKKMAVFVLLTGTLIEFKVYAGLVVLSGLLMISLQQFMLYKQLGLFSVFIPSTLVSALLFIPQNQQSSGLIVFQPFWFIHAMVESPDRLGFGKLAEARMAYQQRGETMKFLLTELLAFIIYIVGNLGTRFVALFLIPGVFLERVRKNLLLSFILWMIVISFTVPILFIQKGTPWNTIQFSYYGLYLLSVFAGLGLWYFWRIISYFSLRLPRFFSGFMRVFGIGFIVVILSLTPISSYATFEGGLGSIPPARLPFGEMEALRFLAKEDFGVVLTHPYQKEMRNMFEPPFPLFAYETSSYVSAFSKKTTFIEDEIQMEIMQIDYQKRLVLATEFFRGRDANWSRDFLKTNSIRYIYLPKVYGISLSEDELGIKKIFENSQVDIFKVE